MKFTTRPVEVEAFAYHNTTTSRRLLMEQGALIEYDDESGVGRYHIYSTDGFNRQELVDGDFVVKWGDGRWTTHRPSAFAKNFDPINMAVVDL